MSSIASMNLVAPCWQATCWASLLTMRPEIVRRKGLLLYNILCFVFGNEVESLDKSRRMCNQYNYRHWDLSFDHQTQALILSQRGICCSRVAAMIPLRRFCVANNIPVLYSLGIKDIFTTSSSLNCHDIRNAIVITPKASNLERFGHGLNDRDLGLALRSDLLGLPHSRQAHSVLVDVV